MSTTSGNCELCGDVDTQLIEGICGGCRKRYKLATPVTRDSVLAALAGHIGAARGIAISELVDLACGSRVESWARAGVERWVRKLIEELRTGGHHICAHPATGYYMAATPEELDRTCLFLYERAMTSLRQVAAMKRVSLPDLRGQLQLRT